jgi:signal peptidase complex subunit 3
MTLFIDNLTHIYFIPDSILFHMQRRTQTHTIYIVVKVLALNTLRSLKSHGGVDRALLSFDIQVDLTPAFHWNVKQLFVYVVAIYHAKIISEENVFVKYALVDQGHQLRGQNVTLQLQWDHMPITGTVHLDKQPLEGTSHFILPSEYQ